MGYVEELELLAYKPFLHYNNRRLCLVGHTQFLAWFIWANFWFTYTRSEHPQMRVYTYNPHLRMLTPRRIFLQSKCKGDAADSEPHPIFR